MAKPKTAGKAPNAKDLANLALAVTARTSGNPLMVSKASMALLTELGYVEFNDAMADGDKVACRATELGAKYSEINGAPSSVAASTAAAAETVTPPASEFVLEDNIPIPPVKRGGRTPGVARYPFATMAVNQSFFIPKTDDNPKPAKRVASAVSGASKSQAPKKFKVQAVDENGKIGARVWRTA